MHISGFAARCATEDAKDAQQMLYPMREEQEQGIRASPQAGNPIFTQIHLVYIT
jgi:hypothetical protein